MLPCRPTRDGRANTLYNLLMQRTNSLVTLRANILYTLLVQEAKTLFTLRASTTLTLTATSLCSTSINPALDLMVSKLFILWNNTVAIPATRPVFISCRSRIWMSSKSGAPTFPL